MGQGWVARLGPPRSLRFAGIEAELDLPSAVSAGSGLRLWRDRLVILQDDVNALALLDNASGEVRPLLLPADASGQRSFSDRRGNKADKMDLEACVVLPDGRLVALGSGSTPARERLVVVDQELHTRVVDGAALFAQLRAERQLCGSQLNIEGAVVAGDSLRLFQRGNGATIGGITASNAIGDLDLRRFIHWLDGVGPVPAVSRVRRVDLGSIDGVAIGFTDATMLPDGRIAFVACAEASPDTYRDGELLGTRFGVLEEDGFALFAVMDEQGHPTRHKLEGIDFVRIGPAGGPEFAVVADMDDVAQPAMLASLTWGP